MITAIIIIFIVGYVAIAMEQLLSLNKAASALITGVVCWTIYSLSHEGSLVTTQLEGHLGNIAGILFFLLGAMTIVELVDMHGGFTVITSRITFRKKSKLLWVSCLFTFFLSAVLDNLTTAIIMVSLISRLVHERSDRWYFCGMIVIAANAGGAWSPMGDVTTTMLWIDGQTSALQLISKLFLPSFACLVVPLLILSPKLKGEIEAGSYGANSSLLGTSVLTRNIVFVTGIGILFLVPIFKLVTHLPPYIGILLGLGIIWIVTEIVNPLKSRVIKTDLSVEKALGKIDIASILFFLGILLSVSALDSAGILNGLSSALDRHLNYPTLIAAFIGLLSALIDNVPLVAASIGMYNLNRFPSDHSFWLFLAYTAGTGGSILIIGSAAGVAAMGIEKIGFLWYLRKIAWLAIVGFIAGALVFIAEQWLFNF